MRSTEAETLALPRAMVAGMEIYTGNSISWRWPPQDGQSGKMGSVVAESQPQLHAQQQQGMWRRQPQPQEERAQLLLQHMIRSPKYKLVGRGAARSSVPHSTLYAASRGRGTERGESGAWSGRQGACTTRCYKKPGFTYISHPYADPIYEVTDMESIWSKTAGLAPRPALAGDIETEAAVVGGGLAGVLIAHELQARGIKTVLLEAKGLGSGQTRNTTAKVTSQHGLKYQTLIKNMGEERAGQYARANQRAIADYRAIILENKIDCDWEDRPAYLYTTSDAEQLQKESVAAAQLGIAAKFTTDTALPFSVKGAVRFEGQAQLHPLKFLQAVAKELTIYEQTRVLEAQGHRLITPNGTVRAKHIVFAVHFPFINVPGYYFLRMHQERSYVLALEGAQELGGMYLGVDAGGLSFRNYGDSLLLGGGSHRTGENSAGGRYSLLRQAANRYWPQAKEIACWSAQDCIPLDAVPYIGRFSSAKPDWYVATGFQKWGMTSAMVSAKLLTGLIVDGSAPDAEVFAPQRFEWGASAKNLWEDGKQALQGLGRTLFSPPRAALEALPKGHGGVVECDEGKAGVYKDEKGCLFIVSLHCPHLGCQLEWNPDEKSWDCPCHGSRFDFRGCLMDSPAQKNLNEKEEM